MRIDRHTRLWLHLNSAATGIALVLVLALVAWLSTRYTLATEWSTAGRGELADGSIELLEELDDRLDIVAFVRPDDFLAGHIERLVERYQRHHSDLRFRAINPDARPDLVRQFGVEGQGEMVVEYQGRQERVAAPSEPRLSAAIAALAGTDGRPVVYPQGHGERDLRGEANHDLGSFGQHLGDQGHALEAITALEDGVPEEAGVLVIAGPRSDWLPGAEAAVTDWVEQGGNLLWLVDDGDRERLDFLAEALAIEILPGQVVEPRAEELLGVDNPRLLVLGDHPRHPVVDNLEGVSLFVGARALELTDAADERWQISQLLRSEERHWVETGDPDSPEFDADAGDRRGPVTLGLTLTRALDETREQRVAVVGNAEFLANAYVGNGANMELGLQLVDWLTDGSGAGAVPARAAPDQTLELSSAQMIVIGFGFLVAIPAVWLGAAGWAWWRRRRG